MFFKKLASFQSWIFPLVLAGIVGVLASVNYTPGTILSGWDTLHPEFNLPLAFERTINGVWRTDQGLGAVAIQSHMADLPRIMYLWIMSFVLPMSLLRYGYFFLMLLVGPLGMYVLASHLMRFTHKNQLFGFLAGLTYLANLGTVQHFIVPLEMFATQYGLLPWILWTTIKLLTNFSRKMFLLFCIIIFFASAQAHTATLFYAFFGAYTLFLGFYIALHARQFTHLTRKATILVLTILSINVYWMLPNIYATKNHGTDVRISKVNRLFSVEAFAKNQEFGTVTNAMILKNFLFDWEIYRFDNQRPHFEQVLTPWATHLKSPLISMIGYAVFALAVIGIYTTFLYKQKKTLALIPFAIIPFLMLLNGTYPITIFFERLGNVSPILSEALRFPFTKFSILFMMALSVYTAYGILALFVLIKRYSRIQYALALCYSMLLLTYFSPAFTGNLIHPAMRITYPLEYNEMFNWFNTQDTHARVAILPIHSFWNWVYYDWGYQGAGFLQFGIPQPILDRDYDRWSPYNEQYQREMTYAIYSIRPDLLRNVLEKYHIQFLLIDDSVVNVGGRLEAKFTSTLPGLLEQTAIAQKVQTFGEKISVYAINTATGPVNMLNSLPSIGPTMFGGSEDTTYSLLGPYITKPHNNQIIDPFRGAFSHNERFILDPIEKTPVATFPTDLNNLQPQKPCSGETLKGSRKRINGVIQYTSVNTPQCDHIEFSGLPHDRAYIVEITHRHIAGFPMQLCISNDFGRKCDVYTHLHTTQNMITERFLLPPLRDWGDTYTFNINNFAIRGLMSINELKEIKIYRINYEKLTQTPGTYKYVQTPNIFNTTKQYKIEITKIPLTATWIYKATLPSQSTLIELDQSYEKGWRAYVVNIKCQNSKLKCQMGIFLPILFGKEMKEHVLINNWANGWSIDDKITNNTTVLQSSNLTIVIFFLPQLLQWIGFALLPVPFIIIWKMWRRK